MTFDENLKLLFTKTSQFVNTGEFLGEVYFPFHRGKGLSWEDEEAEFTLEEVVNSDFNNFLDTLKNSNVNKMFCPISRPDLLWSTSRVALLLTDAVVLAGPEHSAPEVGVTYQSEFGRLTVPGTSNVMYSRFMRFQDGILKTWLDDASNLIRDGRVVYIPGRLLYWVEYRGKKPIYRSEDVLFDVEPPVLKNAAVANRGGAMLLRTIKAKQHQSKTLVELFNVSMPFLEGVSLKLLHHVLIDEVDTLVPFRQVIANAIPDYLNEAAKTDSPDELKRVGAKIRTELIEPELASLNRLFSKIMQSRAIRMSGATLGIAGLAVSALFGPAALSSVSSLLGATGLGLLAKEYAEYRAEILSARENPWYFLWNLKRKDSR